MSNTKVCCGTCLYAVEYEDQNDEGHRVIRLACHRFPPQFVVHDNQMIAMNPVVERLNYCGEHCDRPEPGRKPS